MAATDFLCDQLEPWVRRTFGTALAAVAARRPQAEAIVASGKRLTYGELYEGARRAAAGLLALGIKRGDHVAICMENSVEWVTLFYGCSLIGAVIVSVNTRFKESELRYCLAQSDACALIVVDRFLKIDFISMLRAILPEIDTNLPGAALPELRSLVVRGDDVPKAARPFEALCRPLSPETTATLDRAAAEVQPGDIALIQYTSGTTADPKGVMLTHDNMLRNAANVAACIGIRAEDRYFSSRPYFHVAGTTLSILAAMASGATLLTVPVFDVDDALRVLSVERCTLISGNDTIFLMIFNHPQRTDYRLHLRGGWAAAGFEVMQQARDRLGMRDLVYAYGLSEASPNVIMSRHDEPVEDRLTGITKPHKGVDVRIVDLESGGVLPPNLPGEIQVRGWNVMKGYYKKPEATANAFSDGWLRTGDIGVLDARGRLRFIGRAKDMLRVGGENVAPADVEEVLHGHPKVKQAQVVGVPDARLGEVVAAYVVLKEGAVAEPQEFVDWCKSRCANFKVPRYVRLIDTFEGIGMTGSNKVQKNKLRDQALIDFNLG